jgi:MFS family permease
VTTGTQAPGDPAPTEPEQPGQVGLDRRTAGRARALHALRSRDFRLFFAGQSVSLIGNAAFSIALGWRTYTLTGHASSLAFVLAAQAAATIATLLIGGVLADRYDRRRLMIASDVGRFLAVAALAGLDASGHLSFDALLVFAVLVGLGEGFFIPAFGGMVPLVVETPMLASANALVGIARQGSSLIGPGLAAALYAPLGSSAVFAVDAASFLVASGLLLLARPRHQAPAPRTSARREVGEGFRYVASVPFVWITIAASSLLLMIQVAPFQVLLPGLVKNEWHHGAGGYGALASAMGAGMIVGALTFGTLAPRRHRAPLSYVMFTLNSACVVGIGLTPWFEGALALQVVRGLFVGFGIALWETTLMELVPERLLARVISLDFFGSIGLMPLGYALAAVLAGLASPSVIVAAGAVVGVALFGGALAWPRARRID